MNELLHVARSGQGPDLVLLHGWGMNGGVWHGLLESLQPFYRLHRVDLPGHGQSRQVEGEFDLDTLGELIWQSVAPQLEGPAIWLGWSLGGLAALQIALQHRAQVRALILVASTPRFSQAADWPHAMAPALLETFATQLSDDYRATLQRFLALQVKGSEDARGALRELRQRVLEQADADIMALHSGLNILKQADLRSRLDEIRALPVLGLFGQNDMLVPVQAAQQLAGYFENSQIRVIDSAGHAPFISHPQLFSQQVIEFLHATG